jgi:hypothetical protein
MSDQPENVHKAAVITPPDLQNYRTPAASEIPPAVPSSAMKAISGDNDVRIVGHDKASAPAKGPADGSSPVKQFEQEKKDAGFTQNSDGSYSINGRDGKTYTVKQGEDSNEPPTVTTKDANGQPVTVPSDSDTAKSITSKVEELANKQSWLDQMKATPLNPEQQKAYDQMFAALQKGDLAGVQSVAQQFANNPKDFDAVFTHLLGSTVLSNMKDTYLSWGHSDTGGTFTAQYGGGSPEISVPLGDQRKAG